MVGSLRKISGNFPRVVRNEEIMTQIKAYHRPKNLSEALQLISRPGVNTKVVAGGTYLVPHLDELVDEVVDLQAIGLTSIDYSGATATFGAMVTLQTLVDDERTPTLLRECAGREGPNTFRNAGTLGGVIAGAGQDSELIAALLVLDATVQVETGTRPKTVPLANFLRDVPSALNGGLITAVTVATEGSTAGDRVARTPADTPIVAAVARKAADGNIRLALCGVASTPVLLDPKTDVKAAINPPADFRGSTEYRRQMAATLTRRVLAELE
jgi:carbon-monoxide dehydrogenase medium subunit